MFDPFLSLNFWGDWAWKLLSPTTKAFSYFPSKWIWFYPMALAYVFKFCQNTWYRFVPFKPCLAPKFPKRSLCVRTSRDEALPHTKSLVQPSCGIIIGHMLSITLVSWVSGIMHNSWHALLYLGVISRHRGMLWIFVAFFHVSDHAFRQALWFWSFNGKFK